MLLYIKTGSRENTIKARTNGAFKSYFRPEHTNSKKGLHGKYSGPEQLLVYFILMLHMIYFYNNTTNEIISINFGTLDSKLYHFCLSTNTAHI